MARILTVLVVLAAGSAVGAALFAHGSQAAPQTAAAIQRTFVSTSGSDANPCTAAQPCRGFAPAIANTLAGGEVVALDSGGYGPFSVGKSITIAGAPGAHVAVTAFAGTAITVNAGATDTVVLRNLYLTALGGDTGIFFQNGGSLYVESVVASGFGFEGLDATAGGASVFVRDSVFRLGGEGVVANGSLHVEISDTRADQNAIGFDFTNGVRGSVSRSAATRNTEAGFVFQSAAVFAVSDSVADGTGQGDGVSIFDAGTQATLSGVTLSNNDQGGLHLGFGAAVARIGGSTVTANGIGLWREAGTLETFGDNLVRGNATETSGTITAVAKT